MSLAADKEKGVEIQDRDLAILRGLFESRIMTAEHVAAVHFGGRYEAARKRLQKLKSAGFVGERPRRAYEPAVLFLTRKAFVQLVQSGSITDLPRITWKSLEKRVRVSPLTLQHELEVQDVKSAIYRAVANVPGLEIAEFSTWPVLFQFRAYNAAGELVMVKPDGFIRIRESTSGGELFEHMFFLEVDRSTETLDTLAQRASCYRDYYRRGGMATKHHHPSEDFERFPFRVLMTFKTCERRNHVGQMLLDARPPILTQVWLATLSDATKNPLGSIWIRPISFRSTSRFLNDATAEYKSSYIRCAEDAQPQALFLGKSA